MPAPRNYPLWNTNRRDWSDYEIAGARHHLDAIERLLPRGWDRDGQELLCELALVPEPDNPYGTYAISVRAGDAVLGYIASEDSARWAPVIYRIAGSGYRATTPGRIWVCERDDWSGTDGRGRRSARIHAAVRIRLGEPETALPLNDPPAVPYTMLPRSGIVQVTKEQDHFDTLFEHVPAAGYGLLYATLHAVTVTTARTTRTLVEVRIDNENIGQLTLDMSRRFLPLIEHLRSHGLVAACWSDITGSSVAAEVRIDAAKANEAADTVLDGPAVGLPALVSVKPDPYDYDVPNAYNGPSRPGRKNRGTALRQHPTDKVASPASAFRGVGAANTTSTPPQPTVFESSGTSGAPMHGGGTAPHSSGLNLNAPIR